MLRYLGAALILLVPLSAPAHATQVCAWLTESNEPDRVRELTLWLQADTDVGFLYKVGGRGIVTDSGESNAPTSATYILHAGQADSPWHYGSTLEPPGKIDISLAIHRMPTDVFSTAPEPLLAKFAFARDVPAGEKAPPATLANKQCMEIVVGGY
jgi:hypothetical protein